MSASKVVVVAVEIVVLDVKVLLPIVVVVVDVDFVVVDDELVKVVNKLEFEELETTGHWYSFSIYLIKIIIFYLLSFLFYFE